MLTFRNILVPTDFSEPSTAAFRMAAALARDHGANLIVLHVREIPPAPLPTFGTVAPPDEGQHKLLLDKLEQVELSDGSVSVEYVMVDGEAGEEIVKVATDRRCDLIVLGTHGRTGLGRLLMGSVTLEVMRKAPCPVLTLKHFVPATAKAQ